jgi:hypothetical protein
VGHRNVSRINKARKHDAAPQPSSEAALLLELGRERDAAQRRLELVQRLIGQRDQLVEQVDAIRELSERLMEEDERKQQQLGALESKLIAQAARIQELERTLKMLAEAEENLERA